MSDTQRPKVTSFRDLEIWKRSVKLVEEIYSATQNFPKEEIYGLVSQIRRSAISIPSNIAEGFSRVSNREYKQFLYISLGSCAEVTTQIIIAKNLHYIKDANADTLLKETEEISKMMMSLIKKINNKLPANNYRPTTND